jgi:hypothetical protein
MSYCYLVAKYDPMLNSGQPVVIDSMIDKEKLQWMAEFFPKVRFSIHLLRDEQIDTKLPEELTEADGEYIELLSLHGPKLIFSYDKLEGFDTEFKDIVNKLCDLNKTEYDKFMEHYTGVFTVLDRHSNTNEWIWDNKNQYFTKKLPVPQIDSQEEYLQSLDKMCRAYTKSDKVDRCQQKRVGESLFCKAHEKKKKKETWNLPSLDPFHICRCAGCTRNTNFQEKKSNNHATQCWCHLCVCESRRLCGKYCDRAYLK